MMLGLNGFIWAGVSEGSFGCSGGFGFLDDVGEGGGGPWANCDMWEVFGTNVEEEEFLIAFFFVADGALCDVTANGLVIIGGQAQEARSSSHSTFEVSTCFSLCLEHCTTINTFVRNSGQGSEGAQPVSWGGAEALV
jgi:hypothetical protein